jgi:hypothetical protein
MEELDDVRYFKFIWRDPGNRVTDVSVRYKVLAPLDYTNVATWDDTAILKDKRVKLARKKDVFQLKVELPDRMVFYRFKVQSEWTIDKGAPRVRDWKGTVHNILCPPRHAHTPRLPHASLHGRRLPP